MFQKTSIAVATRSRGKMLKRVNDNVQNNLPLKYVVLSIAVKGK